MAIKVLIVDDSAIIRSAFQKHLAGVSDIEVIGTAPDAYIARDMIVKLHPDVITLDINMPRIDGITFLARLMKHYPLPVIVVSKHASEIAFEAMRYGAVDVVKKPDSDASINEVVVSLVEKIRAAYASKNKIARMSQSEPVSYSRRSSLSRTTDKIVAIGASTGGTRAIEEIIQAFPEDGPAVVIVQHMPAGFTKAFSDRLNSICRIEVHEAKNADVVQQGRVLVAPGDYHMMIKRHGNGYIVEVKQGPLVGRHRPAVNVLFKSVAQYVQSNAIGVILTGMGEDGAQGMLEMKKAGALTIAQDEESSVVFGMPKVAIELECIDHIVPLSGIASKVLSLV